MAKKRFTNPNEPVERPDEQAVSQPAHARSQSSMEEPAIDDRKIAAAKGEKSMAGQYKRKQILIPPAQLQYIKRKAKELGVSQAELFRWLIDYGLTALDSGIELEIEVVEVRSEVKKSHWSSQ